MRTRLIYFCAIVMYFELMAILNDWSFSIPHLLAIFISGALIAYLLTSIK